MCLISLGLHRTRRPPVDRPAHAATGARPVPPPPLPHRRLPQVCHDVRLLVRGDSKRSDSPHKHYALGQQPCGGWHSDPAPSAAPLLQPPHSAPPDSARCGEGAPHAAGPLRLAARVLGRRPTRVPPGGEQLQGARAVSPGRPALPVGTCTVPDQTTTITMTDQSPGPPPQVLNGGEMAESMYTKASLEGSTHYAVVRAETDGCYCCRQPSRCSERPAIKSPVLLHSLTPAGGGLAARAPGPEFSLVESGY